MTMTAVKYNPKKHYAAQNAKDGLINVGDLSSLTGIATTRLTRFAKIGLLNHYGEYQGKRFYNFEEVVNWMSDMDSDDVAKEEIRKSIEVELRTNDCPYSIETIVAASEGARRFKIVWKEIIPE